MLLLQRIQERKLFQWAAAYLAGAWLLLQVVSAVSDAFAWSALVSRATIVVLAVGFPAALIVAWYHGEQGRQRASGVELLMLSGILLVAGVAVTSLERPGPPSAPRHPALASAFTASAPVAEQGSIAVLPFADMSPAGDQAYFADGLSEELLNVLARIPELRVAARTSSFSFKGTNASVDSIGRALKVAYVLEGSVRKAEGRVRITAQLVDARNGFHLWSETYDRDLADVFAVQDEISRAIVQQLQLQLSGGRDQGTLAKQETSDPEAHALLLRGIAAYRNGETVAEAEELFREATRRDPSYAHAHAQLANVLMVLAYQRRRPVDRGYAAARAAAMRALALDSAQSMAHTVLGTIARWRDWDFAAAEAHYQRALASNPADSRARSWRAVLLMQLGKRDEAFREGRRSVELDPLSTPAYNNLGVVYDFARQPQQAVEAYRAALALAPEAVTPASHLALAYSHLDRHAEAIRTAEELRSRDPENQVTLSTLGRVYARAGDRAKAEKVLKMLRALPDASPYLIAAVYAGMGEQERMFEMLEQALRQRDERMPELGMNPDFDEYRGDPRLARLLQRIGLD